MPEESFEERTEPATGHKRGEARQRGQVARSQELNSAVIILFAILAMNFFAKEFIKTLTLPLTYYLENLHLMPDEQTEMLNVIYKGSIAIGIAALPYIIVIVAASIAVNYLQVGFLVTAEPLTPNFNKLNPFTGIQRLFKLRNLMTIIFGILKMSIIGAITFATISAEKEMIIKLLDMEFANVVKFILEIVFVISLRCALALLIIGLLDYLYQRWQYERDLKMSKQEVKEEMKRLEGDPKIKERRKSVHRQLILQRMFHKVPKATVVITNPTEIAVALEYSQGMKAPIVVAKGMGLIAERIRRIANENSVPIVQRPDLARSLHRLCEVDDEIPEALYKAVAEILAFVTRLKEQGFATVSK